MLPTTAYDDPDQVGDRLDQLHRLVGRVFSIEEIILGEPKQNFIVKYRGQLLADSVEAYDSLSESLRSLMITPLFRMEDGRQTVVLLPFVINPKASNPIVNLVLFVLTLLSVILAGAIYAYDGEPVASYGELVSSLLGNLWSGVPFAISILAILLAHEFGHYLAARFHRTHVTLPYFIPFPLSYFGTMGAFIQLKEPPRNKRVLLDIGIAGPLAGLFVAVPVLLIGLSLSEISQIPRAIQPGLAVSMEGNSILYLAAKYLTFGQLLPEPSSYGSTSPALYWLRYFFTSQPFPFGGTDVFLHPVAWAGWAGLLVTALNLIPAGQLDGGHVLYVLLGRGARAFLPVILGILILLGTVWAGWWLWAGIIFLLGRVHAEPLDQITRLDPRRRLVALSGLVIFFLVFTPVPLVLITG
jgi:membrane-associated protease RseP (regulator of RpoE activity)